MKNDFHLNFAIPYEFQQQSQRYFPDFIAYIDDGKGEDDLLRLIVEVSGSMPMHQEKKARKVWTAEKMWVPSVNALKRFGRWDFLELRQPSSFESELCAFIAKKREAC